MKKIKVCADPFPPYQYIDANGVIQGSDYEVVMNKPKKAGYEPEMCVAPWNKIYREFEEGVQHVLFQAQDSPERLEKFYLSKLFRHAVTEVVTCNPALAELKNYSELENYKIAVIADFSNGPEIDTLSDSCKVEFADAQEVIDAVCDGTVDCGVCDQGVKEYLMKNKKMPYTISALTYKRPLYVMFRHKKHRDDFDAVD